MKWMVKMDCNSPLPTIRQEAVHISSIQGFFEDSTTNHSMISTVHSLHQAAV